MFQRLHSKELSRNRRGTGDREEDHGASWRADMGRIGGRTRVRHSSSRFRRTRGHEMSLDKVHSSCPAMPWEHAGCPNTIANGDDLMAMANFRLDDRQEPSPRFRKSNDLNWWHYRRQGPFHSYQQLNLMLPMQVKKRSSSDIARLLRVSPWQRSPTTTGSCRERSESSILAVCSICIVLKSSP